MVFARSPPFHSLYKNFTAGDCTVRIYIHKPTYLALSYPVLVHVVNCHSVSIAERYLFRTTSLPFICRQIANFDLAQSGLTRVSH